MTSGLCYNLGMKKSPNAASIRCLLILAGCLLAGALSACNVLYPVDPLTRLVFQDDFTDRQSGWPERTSWEGQVGYAEGAYRMKIAAPGANLSAALPQTYVFPSDLEIQVDARLLGGPLDNRYGVICRYQNALSYYWFAISSDGYYGIGKMKDGQASLINTSQMPPSELIKKGQDVNHFRVECVQDRLRLYLNDNLLAEQQDAEFTGGAVGFFVGAAAEAGVEVAFEHLTVKEAEK